MNTSSGAVGDNTANVFAGTTVTANETTGTITGSNTTSVKVELSGSRYIYGRSQCTLKLHPSKQYSVYKDNGNVRPQSRACKYYIKF